MRADTRCGHMTQSTALLHGHWTMTLSWLSLAMALCWTHGEVLVSPPATSRRDATAVAAAARVCGERVAESLAIGCDAPLSPWVSATR